MAIVLILASMSNLRPPTQHTHLDQVDDSLHDGSLRPVLVVGGVEQRVEGVVEPSVDGPIHQTVHARIREQIETSAQQVGHLDNLLKSQYQHTIIAIAC